MIKIFKNLKIKEWFMILVSIVLIVGQVWLDLKLPDYMSSITKLIETPGSKMSEIWFNGGMMLACALGSALMAVVCGFFAAKIAATLSKRLRGQVFDKVQNFSTNEIQKFSTSSLITRTTNDITQIQMFFTMGMQVIIKAPILAVWAIIKILGKSWQWSIATACAVLLLMIMLAVIIIFVIPKFRKIQTLTDNLNKVTSENLTGVRIVRAYNAEKFESEKFEKANSTLTKTNLFTNRMMSIMNPVMTLLMSVLSLSIYWIGAYLINSATVTMKLSIFSDMIVFSSYAMQVVMAFMMLTLIFIMLPRATVSAKRINEVTQTQSSIIDGKGVESSDLKGVIEFRNVCFKYPGADEYVLKNISFTINQGETVAFIGSTGSGKSTLINLIPRFYDATEGVILVDGVNVKEYTLKQLYNKLGYVLQKPVLFGGTVESNITFGDDIDEKPTNEEIKKALAISQSDTFVANMENGINSDINQGGKNISGGQKQRLSIARAIARNPEILIFDDSFSALDYKTDKKLRKALNTELHDTTCLIVATRIGTITQADKIVVLENGEAVGIGTHRELMSSCQVYQEIASSQLSQEELENDK